MSPTRVLPRPGTPPPPVTPPPVTPPTPPTLLGAPKGTIPLGLKIAYGRGGPWSDVNRYDQHFVKYGTQYRVPPAMLKAMAVIESGGQSIPNGNGFPNWGVMQLSHSWNGGSQTKWERVGKKLGVDFKSPEGQIATAAYVLGGHDGDRGSPEEIFLNHYYPIPGGLDARGPDGHTQREYLSDMHRLVEIINAAATTLPPPTPPMAVDIVSTIVGGKPTDTSYGFKHPTNLPYYGYFNGHGGNEHQHPGIDATTTIGQRLYTPIAGTVVCGGTDKGPGAWGTGCALFNDIMGQGAGRVEILAEDGKRSLILGHISRALVAPGQKVKAGDAVAEAGGMNGPHVHIEARIWDGQRYTIVDPRRAFGGGVAMPDQPITLYISHRLPGTDKPFYLPDWVPFRVSLTPKGENRSGTPMRPTVTTFHSTNNPTPGTGAAHHARWQANGTPGNPGIGVHGYVDAKEVVWTIPIDEKGVHAGDWRNDVGIAVERTTNRDQDQAEAENNAMHVHAGLLHILGKTAIDAMYPHTNGGHCPQLTRPWKEVERIVDMRIERIKAIQ